MGIACAKALWSGRGVVKSRLEWWCLRLDEGVMGKEEAGEARGGGLGWVPLWGAVVSS